VLGGTAQANSGGYLRMITEWMRYAFPSNLTGHQLPRRRRQRGAACRYAGMDRYWENLCRCASPASPAGDLLPDPVAPRR
jgi:hypothetical protein